MNFVDNVLKNYSCVRIAEEKRSMVEQILHQINDDGKEKLSIISDFDFTWTMYEQNGVRLPSTYAVIETDPEVKLPDGSPVKKFADQLRAKYHSIEIDPKLSIEDKITPMTQWWTEAQKLFVESNLTRTMLQNIVNRSKLQLKSGVREFVVEALHSKIPILLFSAGLGDVIQIVLEKNVPEFHPNRSLTHLISNWMKYDENGKLTDFNQPLIHSFNKNFREIPEEQFSKLITDRPNVILFGDTIGDVGMIQGLTNMKTSLKIGFLNHDCPETLQQFLNAFHIVVCDRQTFDIPMAILKAI